MPWCNRKKGKTLLIVTALVESRKVARHSETTVLARVVELWGQEKSKALKVFVT